MALDVMEEKFKTALKEKGPGIDRYVRFWSVDYLGRLCRVKLFKAGFRSNNIDPNARHCMASAGSSLRTFGMDEPIGCYDDIEQAARRVCAVGR